MKSMVGAGAMAALVLDGAYGAVVGALAGGWCLTEALWERERHWRTVLSRSAGVVVPAIGALVLLKTALSTSVHPASEQSPASLSESLPWWPLQLVGGTDLRASSFRLFLSEHLPRPQDIGMWSTQALPWRWRPVGRLVSVCPEDQILAVLAGVMALGPRSGGSEFRWFHAARCLALGCRGPESVSTGRFGFIGTVDGRGFGLGARGGPFQAFIAWPLAGDCCGVVRWSADSGAVPTTPNPIGPVES